MAGTPKLTPRSEMYTPDSDQNLMAEFEAIVQGNGATPGAPKVLLTAPIDDLVNPNHPKGDPFVGRTH